MCLPLSTLIIVSITVLRMNILHKIYLHTYLQLFGCEGVAISSPPTKPGSNAPRDIGQTLPGLHQMPRLKGIKHRAVYLAPTWCSTPKTSMESENIPLGKGETSTNNNLLDSVLVFWGCIVFLIFWWVGKTRKNWNIYIYFQRVYIKLIQTYHYLRFTLCVYHLVWRDPQKSSCLRTTCQVVIYPKELVMEAMEVYPRLRPTTSRIFRCPVWMIILESYTLEDYGTWKPPLCKGESSSKPPCLGSMLVFGGVSSTTTNWPYFSWCIWSFLSRTTCLTCANTKCRVAKPKTGGHKRMWINSK